jgi:hypothetical protein
MGERLFTSDETRWVLEKADVSGLCTLDDAKVNEVADRLSAAASWFFYEKTVQSAPLQSALSDELAEIAKLASRLQTALGRDSADGTFEAFPVIRDALIPIAEEEAEARGGFDGFGSVNWACGEIDVTDFQSREYLASALTAIADIQLFADIASGQVSEQAGTTAPLDGLVSAIIDVWASDLDQKVGTSTGSATSKNPGEPTGPLVRFVCAVLENLSPREEGDGRPAFKSEERPYIVGPRRSLSGETDAENYDDADPRPKISKTDIPNAKAVRYRIRKATRATA